MVFLGCATTSEVHPCPAAEMATLRQMESGEENQAIGQRRATWTAERFVNQVQLYLSENRRFSAARLIRTFPDLALDSLRAVPPAGVSRATLLFIAELHDRSTGGTNQTVGWTELVRQRLDSNTECTQHDRARRSMAEALNQGNIQGGLAVRIPSTKAGSPAAILEADLQRIRGMAHLADNDPKKATAAFEKAFELSAAPAPYLASLILLLRGRAFSVLQQNERACAVWTQSAELAAHRLADPNSCDPLFWEAAADDKPEGCAWPAAVARALGNEFGSSPPQKVTLNCFYGNASAMTTCAGTIRNWLCFAFPVPTSGRRMRNPRIVFKARKRWHWLESVKTDRLWPF